MVKLKKKVLVIDIIMEQGLTDDTYTKEKEEGSNKIKDDKTLCFSYLKKKSRCKWLLEGDFLV